jgi:hypothetical protein
MFLKTRHPLTRWAATLASAAVVAAGSIALAPAASAATPNTIVWTAPTFNATWGTLVTSGAGDGRFTLTPQTYTAGAWGPSAAPVTYSASATAQAYDANGAAVDMSTITLPTATCGVYAGNDTTFKTPLTGQINLATSPYTNYVTHCAVTPTTVAGYSVRYTNGKAFIQGEAVLTTTYSAATSVDNQTVLGQYPGTLGYTSVKKNGVAGTAPSATCGIFASADTTYTGTDYQGKKARTGTYNAHCAYAASTQWSTSYNGDVVITVNGLPTVTTVTCPTTPVTYSGAAIEPCTASVTGAGLSSSLTPTYTNNINAGTATANASFAGDATYAPSTGSATFTIAKLATSTVVTCPISVDYNGSAQTPCSVAVSATDGLSQSFQLTDPAAYTNNVATGTASVSYTFPGDSNHASSTGTSTFDIHGTSITTVTCPTAVAYTGSAQTPCTVSVTDGGSLNLTFDAVYTNNTNVGRATASYTWPGDASHASSSDSKTFDITQVSSSVTVNCPISVGYTGAALTPCTATITGAGLNSTVPLQSSDYSNNINVGIANASYTFAGDANHTGSSNSATFGITKRAENVTAASPSITYGDSVPTVSYTIAPTFPSADLITAPTCAAYASADSVFATPLSGVLDAGSYVTHCAGGVFSDNIAASYVDGSLTVAKAASTSVITCSPTSVVYNLVAQTPCSVTVSGAGGLNIITLPDYANNTNAGTATASYTYAGDSNHNGSTATPVNFTITKADSTTTVTCSPTSLVYTAAAQTPCSATVTAPGVSLNPTPTYSNNTNVGNATASYTYAGTANVSGSNASSVFSITPANLTVTASSPAAIAYGANVPAITFTTSPTPITWTTTPTCAVYATADTTYATPLTGIQNAGTYVTHCAGGVSTNYAPTYINGTLTVNTAVIAVTVTASSSTITYGTSVPAVTFTTNPTPITWATTPTCAVYTTADTTFATALTGVQNAGTYVTHCAGGAATGYAPSYVNGTLTISKAATVSVTASSPAAITYGAALPTVTSTTPTGGWTTAPTCGVYTTAASTTRLTGTQNAGAYVTKCSGGTAVNYTTVTYVNGTLTINKAAVTITAQTTTGTRGGRIPTPTYTSNPTAATYTTAPTCRVYNTTDTTFRTPLTGNFPNAAGTYVTRCTGAVSTNYTPSYVNGRITVA